MVVGTVFLLPDMLSQCPFKWNKNPHCNTAGPESTAWLSQFFTGEKLEHFKRARTDLLVTATYAQVDRESFKMCADYMNLLFVVDDVSDNQSGDDAQQTMEVFLKALQGEICDDTVVSRMAKDFMNRHAARFSPNLMRRFLQHNREYLNAVVREAQYRERGEVLTLEEYRKIRRDNGGVVIAYDFIEVSLGLDIPDEVREDAAFQQIFFAALDLVNFSNDVLSYKVEHAQGLADCNVLTVLMHERKFSLQEAADYSGVMYQTLVQQLLRGKEELRSFGPAVDAQLRKYIQGLEDWVAGNLHWSFENRRYFGDEAERVKLTREVWIKKL